MTTRFLVACSLLLALPLQRGFADDPQLPADRVEHCAIFDDPNDPNSDVKLTVHYFLHALSQSGSRIEWQVTRIEIEQSLPTIGLWSEDYPTVETADGHWWVFHADAGSPADVEFGVPPRISGTAISHTTGVQNVQYSIESALEAPANSPCMAPPLINYLLAASQNSQVVIEGEENVGEIIEF